MQVDRPTSNQTQIVQLAPAGWWPDLDIPGHFLVGAGWGLTNEPVDGCPSCSRTSKLQEYAVPLISTQRWVGRAATCNSLLVLICLGTLFSPTAAARV